MSAQSNSPLLPVTTPLGLGDERSWYRRARRYAHNLVEGAVDTWFEYLTLLVIFLNVVQLTLSTIIVEPHCQGSACTRLGERYRAVFAACEWATVALFAVEYAIRIWAAVEEPWVAQHGPLAGRVRYALTFLPLVDLVSLTPYAAILAVGGPAARASPGYVSAVRILRLVRVFKSDRYLDAFSLLGRVLYENHTLLVASSFYSALLWVAAASLLHFTEVDNPTEVGDDFQSIPQALFPTLLMLTHNTPVTEFTVAGKVISGFIAVIAVAIFAVPTGVLGSGFVQAVQESAGTRFTVDVD